MGRNEMIDSLKEGVNKSAPISPDVNNNSNLAQAYQYMKIPAIVLIWKVLDKGTKNI